VERIADHICGAINEIANIKKATSRIVKLAKQMLGIFEDTISIYFSMDKPKREREKQDTAANSKDAIQTLGIATALAQSFQKLGSSSRDKSPREVVLALHLERITSYCADIVEIGINRIIEAEL
jgi:hypothetical protein